jgi:uncharacterized membrane protein YtjA (UPF0391 family)
VQQRAFAYQFIECRRGPVACAAEHPVAKEHHMLGWALTFLVIALIAAVLGFGGIAGASAGIAKILFFVFIVLFALGLIASLVRKTT